MEDFIRNNIRSMGGKEAAEKADIVAARAAIIAAHDETIDLSSLIMGLWIGHEGEMPETVQHGVLTFVQALTKLRMQAYDGPRVS